jgi:hypothetical protein
MRIRASIAAGLLVLLCGVPVAVAAETSGTVVAVIQQSEATGTAGRRMLVTSGPVYQGDNIRTGARGEAQIKLRDNTRLVVGPNSLMVVDDFIYDGGAKAQKVTLNAVRGAFRFITGSSRKDAYEIKTPTATIGVRGTQFDFTIGRGGDLNFALFEGQARICQPGRQCVVVSGACNVVVAPRRQPVRRPTSIEERTKLLTQMFPYVASQTKLRSDFRVDTSSCSVRKASIAPGQSLTVVPANRTAVVEPPPPEPPPTTTGSIGPNRSGLGDGTNPGQGGSHSNSPQVASASGGTNNPGGGGGSNGGGGPGNSGNAPGHNK